MGKTVTVGDVYTAYVKPSLRGLLVIRKRNTRQTSAAVFASQQRLIDYSKGGSPSQRAHKELVAARKCPKKLVYKPGKGYELKPVCSIKKMIPLLRKFMEEAQTGARSHKRAVLAIAPPTPAK